MGKRQHEDGRPRGKITAYAFFIKHQHEVNKDIKLPFSEFSKQCSQIWKNMLDQEKAPFRAQAENDKERYEQELVNFKHNGGVITHNGRITKKSRLEAKDPNLPKRPRTAFFLFSNENREEVKKQHPVFKTTDVARELGRLWSIADENLKNHYQKQSIAEREEYHKKMSVYRQNKAVEAREHELDQKNNQPNSSNYSSATENILNGQIHASQYTPETHLNSDCGGQSSLASQFTTGSHLNSDSTQHNPESQYTTETQFNSEIQSSSQQFNPDSQFDHQQENNSQTDANASHPTQVIQVHPQQIQQIQQIQVPGGHGSGTTYHILTGNQLQLMQAQNSISFEQVSNSE